MKEGTGKEERGRGGFTLPPKGMRKEGKRENGNIFLQEKEKGIKEKKKKKGADDLLLPHP